MINHSIVQVKRHFQFDWGSMPIDCFTCDIGYVQFHFLSQIINSKIWNLKESILGFSSPSFCKVTHQASRRKEKRTKSSYRWVKTNFNPKSIQIGTWKPPKQSLPKNL
jgi:hypothetical protein